MKSKTLAFLKPDIASNPFIVDSVIKSVEAAKLRVLHSKTIQWTKDDAKQFYRAHEKTFFYNRLTGFMSSGPFIALIVEGDGDVITQWRNLIGPTRPLQAKLLQPNSLRAKFGTTDTRNAFHGSDLEHVSSEIALLFPELAKNLQVKV